MSIIDLTELIEEHRSNPSPCDGCEMGWTDINQWTDPKTGHLMQETKVCHDSCEKLKESYRTDEYRKLLELGMAKYRKLWKELADK